MNSGTHYDYGNGEADYSKYVTTTDSNNINLSSISQINSVTISGSEPSGTELRALASFDGRTTWNKYSSGWVAVDGLDFTGSTAASISSGFTNMSITDETSLDFAIELYTSTGAVTPSIDQIIINYDENGLYKLQESNYMVSVKNTTNTVVTKLSSGTSNIKVNILV
jgi:hypothetical protein